MNDRAEAELPDGLPTPRRYVAAAAVLAALVLAVLDGAIANVALPTMSTVLHVSSAAAVWIVTAYQMALVVALLPFSALGESLGYKRVFIAGAATFTAASGLCALSPSLPYLVASRILQGLGAAATMSLLAALLRHTYPQRFLGTALGLNALFVALSSAAGPTLGATILSVASWPWLFAVNLPIGALVLMASPALPSTTPSYRTIDLVSVLLNAGFFAPLVLGVDLLTREPLAAALALVVAAVCLVLLVRREVSRPTPLIPLDLLRIPSIRLSVIASSCVFAAQMLTFVGLPFYLQHGLGLTPFQTGLYMTPWPLTVALAAPTSAKMADRIPSALLCAAGGLTMGLGLVLASSWPLERNVTPLIVFTILSGLGFGFFQTPNNRNMLLSAPIERSGAAGGMQATARLVGQTLGSVLTAIFLSLASGTVAPRMALGAGATLAVAGGLVSVMRLERRSS